LERKEHPVVVTVGARLFVSYHQTRTNEKSQTPSKGLKGSKMGGWGPSARTAEKEGKECGNNKHSVGREEHGHIKHQKTSNEKTVTGASTAVNCKTAAHELIVGTQLLAGNEKKGTNVNSRCHRRERKRIPCNGELEYRYTEERRKKGFLQKIRDPKILDCSLEKPKKRKDTSHKEPKKRHMVGREKVQPDGAGKTDAEKAIKESKETKNTKVMTHKTANRGTY